MDTEVSKIKKAAPMPDAIISKETSKDPFACFLLKAINAAKNDTNAVIRKNREYMVKVLIICYRQIIARIGVAEQLTPNLLRKINGFAHRTLTKR